MNPAKCLALTLLTVILVAAATPTWSAEPMELKIDHVMFPVYYNDGMLEHVEDNWKNRASGKVFSQPHNGTYTGVYLSSKSFYIEYLSSIETEPYWSTAIFVVVPNDYWDAFDDPVMRSDHFLIPHFGSGYQLVSPDFPNLNDTVSKGEDYDGLTILISKALKQELLNISGQKWTLPKNVRVQDGLYHLHDITVIDENSKIVAPLYEANPVLRDFF